MTNSPIRYFRLCHVDALIAFLRLVRAKFMIRNDQNPFEQVQRAKHLAEL